MAGTPPFQKGVGRAAPAAPSPSKPDRRSSRLRLSSRWGPGRGGAALRLVPKPDDQTFGIKLVLDPRLIPPPDSPCGHARWFSFPSFCPSHFPLPACPLLHGRDPFHRYYGRSDFRPPGARTVGPLHRVVVHHDPSLGQLLSQQRRAEVRVTLLSAAGQHLGAHDRRGVATQTGLVDTDPDLTHSAPVAPSGNTLGPFAVGMVARIRTRVSNANGTTTGSVRTLAMPPPPS